MIAARVYTTVHMYTRCVAPEPAPTPIKLASCSRPLHPLKHAALRVGYAQGAGAKMFWCAEMGQGGRVGGSADWPLPGCRTDLESSAELVPFVQNYFFAQKKPFFSSSNHA